MSEPITSSRWNQRPNHAAPRWYTVEYDANGVAWLVSDTNDRVCLEHGMQVDVAQLAWSRPVLAPSAPRKRKRGAS